MFEKFTEGAIKVIMLSQEEARRMGHNFVGTEQLLLGVIGQRHGIGARALKKLKVTLKKARKEIELYIGRGTGFVASEIPFTPRAKRVLEMAVHEGKDLGQNFVGTEHILLALIAESDGVAMRTLDKLNVDIQKLRNLILTYIEETQEEILRPLTQAEKFLLEREKKGSATPTLDEYAENVTKEAIDGNLDPVIGREKEIDDVIAVLARRTKNNPVLIGEPGVGKTAVAEGLAQLILTEKVPDFLDGSLIMALDLGSILAGTKYRGEFEERLKRIVEEAQNDSAVIIVIDEIHTLVGAGAAEGAVDAANLLKPSLARGTLRVIGATTLDEYRRYIEKDPALERRFHSVIVEEPSIETTIDILRGLKPEFQRHHALAYEDSCLELAATLSSRFIADRNLPDKAIDVIDEAGARVRLRNQTLPEGLQKLLLELHETLGDKHDAIAQNQFSLAKELLNHEIEVRTHLRIMRFAMTTKKEFSKYSTPGGPRIDGVVDSDVTKVVSAWTGIPTTKINQSENERLKLMEDILHERLIGQHHAIVSVSKAIRRARVGLRNPDRPIASFIFAGPTGVGKTELTKALSEYMFGNEDSMIRLDMSEYMEKHTVAKLIGSPPGYVGYNEGGQLTEAVRSKPYSVVLLDEVEKAHPDVFNLLLQILEDGRLTDAQGRLVDFKNTLLILTSNIGSKVIEKGSQGGLGFETADDESDSQYDRISSAVNEELKQYFRPEFLNRLDEIIVFSQLNKQNVREIADIMVSQLCDRVLKQGLNLEVTDAVKEKLTDEGYNPIYGARPLRRAIMHLLEDNLAGSFLNTEFKKGSNIIVTLDANGEVKINLTEGTVVPEEEDKSDVPQRRRFALSTMRKRKKEKADQDPVEPVEVS